MMTRRFYRGLLSCALVFLFGTSARTMAQGNCLTVPSPPGGPFDALGVTLLGQVSLQDFGELRATDIWGYVSPSGREYALIGLHESFGIVEVTDPTNPVIVTQIPQSATCWRDIKVFGEYAFAVSDSVANGLLVLDLTDVDNGNVTIATESDLGEGFVDAHNIALNPDSGFAYLCIPNAVFPNFIGFIAVDVSTPLSPTFAGTWFIGGGVRVHDALVVNYTDGIYAGKEIAFAFTEDDGVYILDVTDKSNMFALSSILYPNLTYCHQGWLSEDRRYLFVDDELDEVEAPAVTETTTYVFDVQDLANPQLLGTFTTGLPSSDHNLMVRGRFLYEANYSSGLRVFDINDVNNIQEVGYFDTYPENDDVGAGSVGTGAWGVYTALPSRVIIVSDRNRGLFILSAREAECSVGVPCITPPLPAPFPHNRRKNRYISFDPQKLDNDGLRIAFQVTLKRLTLGSCTGNGGFCRDDRGASDCNICSIDGNPCINQSIDCAPMPPQTCNATGATCVNDAPDVGGTNAGHTWWVGPESPLGNGVHLLVSEAFRKISTSWPNPVHVGDCEIVPEGVYGLRAVNVDTGVASDELVIETTRFASSSSSWWGDAVGPLKKFCGGDIRTAECTGDADCTAPETCDRAWTLPDGSVNFDDVNAALALVAPGPRSVPPDPTWVDLHGNGSGTPGSQNFDPPNFVLNFADIGQILSGFGGFPYKGYDPADCPNSGTWP